MYYIYEIGNYQCKVNLKQFGNILICYEQAVQWISTYFKRNIWKRARETDLLIYNNKKAIFR